MDARIILNDGWSIVVAAPGRFWHRRESRLQELSRSIRSTPEGCSYPAVRVGGSVFSIDPAKLARVQHAPGHETRKAQTVACMVFDSPLPTAEARFGPFVPVGHDVDAADSTSWTPRP